MNIILFLNKDLEANLTYNLLKGELLKHNTKIYYSESVGKGKAKPKDLIEIEYYEKEFIYNDVVEKIRKEGLDTDFEFFNEDFKSFELAECPNVNSAALIEEVSAFKPDLFISIRFAKIFKEEIIKVPKKGILNLHSAILPDYKGIMGTLHNLKDDRKEYGCTLHYISSSGIDTGEIVAIAKANIQKEKSLLWHIVNLYPFGVKLILDSIQKLKYIDKLPFKEQNRLKGNYFSVPTEDDFTKLKTLEFKTFDEADYIELLRKFITEDLIEINKD